MKQNSKIVFLTVLLAAALAVSASARNVEVLAAGPGDLAAADLVAAPGAKALELPREPVALSWALPADKVIDSAEPFTARSREYFVEVSAAELERGVAVLADAPGALVRLNPAPGEKALSPIDPHALVLTDPAGKAFAAGTGMELVATADQLKAAGAPFVEGTAAFRIAAGLGAGTFELEASGLGGGRYVMHVLDAGSDVTLGLRTGASDYLHGQQLVVETELAGAKLAAVDGFVTSPAGRTWPVAFRAAGKGAYRAALELDALEAPAPGLWEVHVRGHGETAAGPVLRSARTAFNVAVPTARFDGAAALAAGDPLNLRLGVETANPGRYEVRGVLYGTADGGEREPIAAAHSAAYLAAGHGTLELAFDQALVDASGLRAPFEIRDLRLIDQGAMGLLHRQERGLRISE